MMEPFDRRPELTKIFRKYLNGTATDDEKRFVEAWYNTFEKEPDILDSYTEEEKQLLENRMEETLTDLTGIHSGRTSLRKTPGNIRWGWVSRLAAAVVLLLSFAGVYYLLKMKKSGQPGTEITQLQDVPPGGDKAVLTLGDGSRIVLDSTAEDTLARQGNMMIRMVEKGLVAYSETENAAGSLQNTVSVPAGGKYSVLLPDGSRVWLNAGSTITFPTSFSEKERKVRITGEVYFDIRKDKKRPFHVDVNGVQAVKVLGTQFNISAYGNENTVTTLVEGSVELSASNGNTDHVQLKPGEQATLSGAGGIRVQENVNTDEVTAWKNGLFYFKDAGIESVMQQFSRWYNVDVVYEGAVPGNRFSGKIDRKVSATEALEVLRFTGINFRIEKTEDAEPGKSRIVITAQ